MLEDGKLVYERIAVKCSEWSQRCTNDPNLLSLGLVVGATDLSALRSVREISPQTWVLCPGVGAQGGSAADVCSAGLRNGIVK